MILKKRFGSRAYLSTCFFKGLSSSTHRSFCCLLKYLRPKYPVCKEYTLPEISNQCHKTCKLLYLKDVNKKNRVNYTHTHCAAEIFKASVGKQSNIRPCYELMRINPVCNPSFQLTKILSFQSNTYSIHQQQPIDHEHYENLSCMYLCRYFFTMANTQHLRVSDNIPL